MTRIAHKHQISAPITAITHLTGSRYALAAQVTDLVLLDLRSATCQPRQTQRWTIFDRERIHRIVLKSKREHEWLAILVGGREAVLTQVKILETRMSVRSLARLKVNDFIGNGAFLHDDYVLLATLHASLLVYRLPNPDLNPDSSSSISLTLEPILTLHAPLRPTLWCTQFSQTSYSAAAKEDGGTGEGEGIRLAGGTMWGDVYLWDVLLEKDLVELAQNASGRDHSKEVQRMGGLRRFTGHKGAIFTASFSPPTQIPSTLLTASDDRTLQLFTLPSFDSTIKALESDRNPPVVPPLEGEEREVLWGHEGRVWRAEFIQEENTVGRIASIGEDATLRIWAPTTSPRAEISPDCSRRSTSGYSLTATYRSGHDGRSTWAVCPIALRAESGGEPAFLGVLTGGADGGVRCWTLPACAPSPEKAGPCAAKPVGPGAMLTKQGKAEKVKGFVATALSGGIGTLVVSLCQDGVFYLSCLPPSCVSTCPTSTILAPHSTTSKPFHSARAFAGPSSAVSMFLLPTPSRSASSGSKNERRRFLAFSNAGHLISAAVSVSTSSAYSTAGVEVERVREWTIPVRAARVDFLEPPSLDDGIEGRGTEEEEEEETIAAVWDRAAWSLSILSIPPANVRFLLSAFSRPEGHVLSPCYASSVYYIANDLDYPVPLPYLARSDRNALPLPLLPPDRDFRRQCTAVLLLLFLH
ncbi:hypothetical protein JCM11641_004773 [Rhodosporidiobolus odoratus]